jgi:transient receptor potential cation channel subfamily M protein 3
MGNISAVRFCDCVLLLLQVLISHENYEMRNMVVQENVKDVIEYDDINQNFHLPLDYFGVKYSRPLGLRKKVYEFYTSPITKFWGDAVSN